MSTSDSSARACWAAICASASSSSGSAPCSWDLSVWLAEASATSTSQPVTPIIAAVAPTSPRLNTRFVLRLSHSCAHTRTPRVIAANTAVTHGNETAESRASLSWSSALCCKVSASGSISLRMSVEAWRW